MVSQLEPCLTERGQFSSYFVISLLMLVVEFPFQKESVERWL